MHPQRSLISAQHLPLVDAVARAVARARRMPTDDVEEFARSVRATVTGGGYAPLRSFEGRASLRTYLAIVLARELQSGGTAAMAGSEPTWVV